VNFNFSFPFRGLRLITGFQIHAQLPLDNSQLALVQLPFTLVKIFLVQFMLKSGASQGFLSAAQFLMNVQDAYFKRIRPCKQIGDSFQM